MKQLWHAEITVSMYVYAETEEEAYDLVSDYGDEEMDNVNSSDWTVWGTVDNTAHLEGDWAESIPYGDDVNDRTCTQILAEIDAKKAMEAEEERRKAEFEAHPKLVF